MALALPQHSQWSVAVEEMRPAGSISFRLGSGAVAASLKDLKDTTMDWTGTTEASLPKSEQSPLTLADTTFLFTSMSTYRFTFY